MCPSPNHFDERQRPLFRAPVHMRAKHAKPMIPYDPWRQARGRLAKGAACALLAGTLMCPNMAFAADYIYVDGSRYDDKTTGASGDGWKWDGGDNMWLDGYNGGSIYAEGDLDISLSGENNIATSGDGSDSAEGFDVSAIGVTEGNLSISGDGSLTATATDDAYEGIYVDKGDLTIDGAQVTVDIENKSYAEGIVADGGDVIIKGGADVTVSAKSRESASGIGSYAWDEEYGGTGKGGNISISDSKVKVSATAGTGSDAYGIYANGSEGSAGGTVSISNSTVDVTSSAFEWDREHLPTALDADDDITPGGNPYLYGILAISGSEKAPASISIDRSSVIAKARDIAMMALNYVDGVIPVRGKISITNSTLVIPEGGTIKDFDSTVEYDGENAYYERGQMIASSLAGANGEWVPASEVVISPVEQKGEQKETPSLIQKAYASTGEDGLARTGDNMGALAGAAVAAAAAAAAVGATAVVRSRKRD